MALRSANINVMIQAATRRRGRWCAISARSRTCRSRSRGRAISSARPTGAPSRSCAASCSRARPGFGFLLEESGVDAGRATATTAGSSIRSTAPPTSCTACRTLPSRSPSSAGRAGRRRGLRSDQGRAVLRREGCWRLSQRPPPAGVGPQRSRHCLIGTGIPVLDWPGRAQGFAGQLERLSGEVAGHPAPRHGLARPRLRRRRPARRLLGIRPETLGHRGRHRAGARGRRPGRPARGRGRSRGRHAGGEQCRAPSEARAAAAR